MHPLLKTAASLATLALACSQALAQTPATLVHHFDFTQGATAAVGGRTGTLMGGASVSGGVLRLAADGDFVEFSGALVPLANDGNASSWTVSAWFHQTVVNPQTFSTFFSAGGNPDHQQGMMLGMLRTGDGGAQPIAYTGVNYGMSLASHTSIYSGWHHLVAVFSSDRGTVYLDGQYKSGIDYTGRALNPDAILNHSITRLGQAAPSLYLSSSQQFIGELDDVRIYAGGLTELQVAAQFALGPNAVSPVPEPATGTLAALGVLAVLMARRRRSR